MNQQLKQNIINYFKHNSIEFTYERKILCDEISNLKEFRSSWVKEMAEKHNISLQTVYTFKNHMIDAKILKPPTDFSFNQNQKEIDKVIQSEPLVRDCHENVKRRIEYSYK
jgi:hypothetical protein